MKTPSAPNALRRGFTLLEVMVATSIMVIIVLAVVTIATDTFKAYDRAVADLSTQSEARGVLDALENDLQTAVLRPDGRCWMEVILPGTPGAPAKAPAPYRQHAGAGSAHPHVLRLPAGSSALESRRLHSSPVIEGRCLRDLLPAWSAFAVRHAR
jgi:prepilin-type N-terminal cleavage/methylation domain-containing protein